MPAAPTTAARRLPDMLSVDDQDRRMVAQPSRHHAHPDPPKAVLHCKRAWLVQSRGAVLGPDVPTTLGA